MVNCGMSKDELIKELHVREGNLRSVNLSLEVPQASELSESGEDNVCEEMDVGLFDQGEKREIGIRW